MRVKSNKRTKLIATLLVLIMLISVGYAFLSTQLTINGTATVKNNSWNVHFANIVLNANNSVASVDTAPTLSNNDTTVTWGVSMDTPGQIYEFNVDVVNEGTIDAMVNTVTNSIVTSALDADQQKYLDYSIKYVNGADIEQYDKLAAGETKTITVKLLFKQDINANDLPSTAQNGITLSYTADYVQADSRAVTKVTEIAQLEAGQTVNYSTTLNGQTLNNWKVFYVDGDYTYLILDGYLPNAAISSTIKTTYNLSTDGTYNIYSQNDRDELINAMTTKSNWDSLLTGTINGHAVSETRTANVWAMGAPTLDLWVDSWNATYPSDTLYTRYVNAEDIDNNNFNATGYAIGDSADPTTTNIDLSSETGYNNTLYYLHHEIVDDCYGYWLASPSAGNVDSVVRVGCGGGVYDDYYGDGPYAFRPVVCLPSSVVNQ